MSVSGPEGTQQARAEKPGAAVSRDSRQREGGLQSGLVGSGLLGPSWLSQTPVRGR